MRRPSVNVSIVETSILNTWSLGSVYDVAVQGSGHEAMRLLHAA